MTDQAFLDLVVGLRRREVRYLMIGVSAANYYARSSGQIFATKDRDLFLPLDAGNLLEAWRVSLECGYVLWAGADPLGEPVDEWLASRVVASRAATAAIHPSGVEVDFTLEMAGFDFESVSSERRHFKVGEVEIPVARLSHIVASKARANRPKDLLFLATYEEELQKLLRSDE